MTHETAQTREARPMTELEELRKLLAEAQTDEPWSVVWYGDEHLPGIAVHRSTEDRVCFMPTIVHPADGVQFEANAALIVAAVNALPELLARLERYEKALQAIVDNAAIDTDAPLFRAQAAAHARAALKETGQ